MRKLMWAVLFVTMLAMYAEAQAPAWLPWILVIGMLMMALLVVTEIVPVSLEKKMNPVINPPPYTVRPDAAELHKNLFVADLHADALMWKRDLLTHHNYGHVDIPRMIEGNSAFQVFGVVTKSPRGQNFSKNTGESDNITLLAVLSAWPPATWNSLFQRAMYQARKLQNVEIRSRGKFVFVRSKTDLEEFLDKRKTDPTMTAGFPCLEGVHALEGKLEHLDDLYETGFRMIGLAHFFDNEAGGSAHGAEKGGLTPFGREVVKKIFEKKMILDLAHASPKVVDEALDMAKGPVVASHTGVRGTCDNVRNLSDEHVRRIAATGGVMGIALFEQAVCGTTIADTVRAIRYVADLVGVDHVAIGSDFDGTVSAPIDISGMPLITEALLDDGFNAEEIAKIMGGNFLRVLRAALPE